MNKPANHVLPESSPRIALNLIAWRLSALMSAVRRSANPAYRRVLGLADFESRVMHQIGGSGPLTLSKLASLLGHDKAQVSRAAKRLATEDLVSRATARGPFLLTAEGKDVFKRLRHLLHRRDATLTRRVSARELRLLPDLLQHVEDNARSLPGSQEPSPSDATLISRASGASNLRRLPRDAAPRSRDVLPALLRLLTVLRSSAVRAYGHVTGMHDFEWNLISQLGQRGTLTSIELVELMNRDKSQVSRAVCRLTAHDIVSARKIGMGRHVLVSITERGRTIYDQLLKVGIKRNRLLLRGFTEAESRALFEIMDKLNEGAARLITEEQALAKPQTSRITRVISEQLKMGR